MNAKRNKNLIETLKFKKISKIITMITNLVIKIKNMILILPCIHNNRNKSIKQINKNTMKLWLGKTKLSNYKEMEYNLLNIIVKFIVLIIHLILIAISKINTNILTIIKIKIKDIFNRVMIYKIIFRTQLI